MAKVPVAPVLADEALDDAELGLDLGRLDVDGGPVVEAGVVALVDVDVLRGAVGREDDLASLGDELVEYLEDDVERLLLVLEELDVVDKEDVGLLVVALELLVAALLLVMGAYGVHVVVDQLG